MQNILYISFNHLIGLERNKNPKMLNQAKKKGVRFIKHHVKFLKKVFGTAQHFLLMYRSHIRLYRKKYLVQFQQFRHLELLMKLQIKQTKHPMVSQEECGQIRGLKFLKLPRKLRQVSFGQTHLTNLIPPLHLEDLRKAELEEREAWRGCIPILN